MWTVAPSSCPTRPGANHGVALERHGGAARPGSLPCLFTGLLLAACAAPPQRAALPFHVAVLPVTVQPSGALAAPEAGSATGIELQFDPERVSDLLAEALEPGFARVSRLDSMGSAGPRDARGAWLADARAQGADLILEPTLTYRPAVHTALNDRFWPNLLLHALGGPLNWLVSDRSYYFQARLEVDLHDATAAAARGRALDSNTRIVRVERRAAESALNFLDRARGVGAFGLALIVPSGFLAPESAAVPAELEGLIARELCAALVQSLQERAAEITVWDRVDFRPEGVRVADSRDGRLLAGEFVLELGLVSELAPLRYRLGSSDFVEVAWLGTDLEPPRDRRNGLRRYRFAIPLRDSAARSIQLEVEQRDRVRTRRRFTFPIPAGREPAEART